MASVDRRVFIDTSAYFAATNQDDANHGAAATIMRRLVAERRQLTTTNFVVAELHALLLTRMGWQVATNTLVAMRASQRVVRVRARDEARAEAIITQYVDKEFSLTDALSFAVMERLDIRVAFAVDRHFAQFGWQVIPLS